MRKLTTVLSVLFTIVSLAAGSSVAQGATSPSTPPAVEVILDGIYTAQVETRTGSYAGSATIKKTGETYHLLMSFSDRIASVVMVAIRTDQVLSGMFVSADGSDGDLVGLMVFDISADQGLIGTWAQLGMEKTLTIRLVRIGDPPPPFVGPPAPEPREEAPPAPPKRRVPVNIGVA